MLAIRNEAARLLNMIELFEPQQYPSCSEHDASEHGMYDISEHDGNRYKISKDHHEKLEKAAQDARAGKQFSGSKSYASIYWIDALRCPKKKTQLLTGGVPSANGEDVEQFRKYAREYGLW